MKYIIHGDKIVVTESIKEYIKDKLEKLEKYFKSAHSVEATIVIKAKGINQKITVTIPTDKYTLRCECEEEDLYKAIDAIVDKLERQIRKNKTKILSRTQKSEGASFNIDYMKEIDEDEDELKKITKRKQMESKPMDEEEAILEMELTSHDFFPFKNSKTDGFSVVYKRKDGNYGIIELN